MNLVDKVNFSSLKKFLSKSHIKLDAHFLDKLLKNSSGCNNYHVNREFVIKIGLGHNKNRKRCFTFYGWFNKEKAMAFSVLSNITKLSDYSFDKISKHIISIKSSTKGGEVFVKFPIKIDKSVD